jgi:CRP/FNR family cyclic AMP-dependent transcriptional regulator
VPNPDPLAAARRGPLGELPPVALDQVLATCHVFSVSAGGRVYEPGQVVGMHVVLTGMVRVAMSSVEGRQLTIRYARDGEVLGVPIVVARAGVPVSVQAVTDVTLARTPPELLWSLAQHDVQVALWLATEAGDRLRGLLEELADNAFRPVRARIARHLLDLATDSQTSATLEARISHQQLADSVGSVREVVARTLASLKRDGLVLTERDRIRIMDPQRLADLT